MQIDNFSPWAHEAMPMWGKNRKLQPILAVKTGFRWDEHGKLTPLTTEEITIEAVERFFDDDAENRSVAAGAELVPFKKGFELFIHGTAYPHKSNVATRVCAELLAKNGHASWSKELLVFGERQWKRSLLGLIPSDPKPLQPLPLAYEYSFGGKNETKENQLFEPNPSGIGFSTLDDIKLLPQIEQRPTITSPKQKVAPAGFAPLASHWQPRLKKLAAMDSEAALAGLCPYPMLVDDTLYNAAPEDQQWSKPPQPTDFIRLTGFHAEQVEQQIEVPVCQPLVLVNKKDKADLTWDTLIIDADNCQLYQIWRAQIPVAVDTLPSLHIQITDPVIEAMLNKASSSEVSEDGTA